MLPPLFRKVLAKPTPVVVETDYVQLQCSTSDNGEEEEIEIPAEVIEELFAGIEENDAGKEKICALS